MTTNKNAAKKKQLNKKNKNELSAAKKAATATPRSKNKPKPPKGPPPPPPRTHDLGGKKNSDREGNPPQEPEPEGTRASLQPSNNDNGEDA